MSENAHSQGEWRLKPDVLGAPIIVNDEREIAKVLYHGGSEDREVQANARLILAAPDMLAALEEVEWADTDDYFELPACPFCGRNEEHGHTGTCLVGNAIRLAKEGHR